MHFSSWFARVEEDGHHSYVVTALGLTSIARRSCQSIVEDYDLLYASSDSIILFGILRPSRDTLMQRQSLVSCTVVPLAAPCSYFRFPATVHTPSIYKTQRTPLHNRHIISCHTHNLTYTRFCPSSCPILLTSHLRTCIAVVVVEAAAAKFWDRYNHNDKHPRAPKQSKENAKNCKMQRHRCHLQPAFNLDAFNQSFQPLLLRLHALHAVHP